MGEARSTVVTVCGADLQFPSPQNFASASATENFDTYQNLQPHRAVLPAIAWHLVKKSLPATLIVDERNFCFGKSVSVYECDQYQNQRVWHEGCCVAVIFYND